MLHISVAIGAALAGGAVGAGIDRWVSATAAATTAGAVHKAKDRDREQDREGAEKVEKVAGFVENKKASAFLFTIRRRRFFVTEGEEKGSPKKATYT